MNLMIYAILDSATGAYMRPWCAQSDGQAMRMFSDIACDENHEIGKHPEDYSLFWIGIFNETTGKIEPKAPEHLVGGLDCVVKGNLRSEQGEVKTFARGKG